MIVVRSSVCLLCIWRGKQIPPCVSWCRTPSPGVRVRGNEANQLPSRKRRFSLSHSFWSHTGEEVGKIHTGEEATKIHTTPYLVVPASDLRPPGLSWRGGPFLASRRTGVDARTTTTTTGTEEGPAGPTYRQPGRRARRRGGGDGSE